LVNRKLRDLIKQPSLNENILRLSVQKADLAEQNADLAEQKADLAEQKADLAG